MSNKTISNKVFSRLVVQANEADIRGDEVVAANITKQIEKYADTASVRPDNASGYKYSKDELKQDIKDLLWQAATRIFDYYNDTPDGKQVEEVVDFETDSFIEYIENMTSKKVGAFEEPTPGQESSSEEEEDDDEDVTESHFNSMELDEDDEDEDDVVYDEDEEGEEEEEEEEEINDEK